MMVRITRGLLLGLVAGVWLTNADAQVVSLDPAYTPSVLANGLAAPDNGLIYRLATNDLLVVEHAGSGIVQVNPATGVKTPFTSVASPSYMAINSAGEVYVNPGNVGGPISRFTSNGSFLGSFSVTGFPQGIAFDSANNFYVADINTGEIHKYAAGNFTSFTIFAGGFASFFGISFSPSSKLFVTDFNLGSVYEITPGGTTIGSHILWATGIAQPSNVAFDPVSGHLFVTTGSSILRVSSPGVITTFATGFTFNKDLDFDSLGNLFADDIATGQIWKFAVPPFDICLQDDSTGNLIQFSSITGNYVFTNCGGLSISGRGSVIRKGLTTTLQDYTADHRVSARIDNGANKGSASVQTFSPAVTFTITDRNTKNDLCACAQR